MSKELIKFAIITVMITGAFVVLAVAAARTRRASNEAWRLYAARLAPVPLTGHLNWLHDAPLRNRAMRAIGDDASKVGHVEARMVEAINASLIAVSGEAFINEAGVLVADEIGRENADEIGLLAYAAVQRVLDDLGEEVIS